MKKGFTLIELLAVIVLLAIIALVATPMILNVIESIRKEAAETSVNGYIESVEKQIVISQLENAELEDGIYDLPIENISVSGEQPSEGWISIKNNQVTNYSMKVMNYVVTKGSEASKEGIIEPKPYICKRADITTLHKETCTWSDEKYQCSGTEKYSNGSIITYGNPTITEGTLISGDAFDCDVNGDKDFDPDTERFYYVSGLDGDNNSDIAVLIYYNNTKQGQPDNTYYSGIEYYSSTAENWHGPLTAVANLPKITDWKKVKLSNSKRIIVNDQGETTTNRGTNNIENPFDYEDYSARLLTANEINSACGITAGGSTIKELDGCDYLLENTKYSSDSMGTYGYWIETPRWYNGQSVFYVTGSDRTVSSSYVTSKYGIRPVIEVLKSDIDF